jgi:hypothetical protein
MDSICNTTGTALGDGLEVARSVEVMMLKGKGTVIKCGIL